jgi:Holliday junction resolvasome RuvABC ATP-dependent DNA helicase subunit
MQRVQFYPSTALANILESEAKKNGVSVSTFVTDLLNEYYGLNTNSRSITQLTAIVLKEVEDYIKNTHGTIEFDLNTASSTYRTIEMTCAGKPKTVRASIGRSFASKVGTNPFANVRQCKINGKNKLSINNALMYETF